jgi:hypothetical protein
MSALSMFQGDQKQIVATITGLSAEQLQGATARFVARQRYDDEPLLDYSTDDAVSVAVDTATVMVMLPVEATEHFPNEPIGLIFDVEVSPSDDSGPITVSQGRLVVYPQVAR